MHCFSPDACLAPLCAGRVGDDPETDVAVVQVTADGMGPTKLTFGNSDRVEVGDFVFAIGNPQPIGHTHDITVKLTGRADSDSRDRQRPAPGKCRARALRKFHPDRRRHLSRQFWRSPGGPARRSRRHEHRATLMGIAKLMPGLPLPTAMKARAGVPKVGDRSQVVPIRLRRRGTHLTGRQGCSPAICRSERTHRCANRRQAISLAA